MCLGFLSYCLYFLIIFSVLSFQDNHVNESPMVEWITANSTLLTAVGTILSPFVASIAAIFAYLAAKSSKNAANASLASNLLDEYSSDEMSSSIRLIGDYFKNNNDVKNIETSSKLFKEKTPTFPTEYNPISPRLVKVSKKCDPTDFECLYEAVWGELDQARRKIYWYYKSTYQLYKKKLIDRRVVEIVADTNGYEVLCKYVFRMSRDIHPPGKDPEKHFKWFYEMVKDFEPETKIDIHVLGG